MTDSPKIAVHNGVKLADVIVDTSFYEVFKHWNVSGGIILENNLTTEMNQITTKLESHLDSVQRSSSISRPDLAAFHGTKTKHAGGIINHSATIRE